MKTRTLCGTIFAAALAALSAQGAFDVRDFGAKGVEAGILKINGARCAFSFGPETKFVDARPPRFPDPTRTVAVRATGAFLIHNGAGRLGVIPLPGGDEYFGITLKQ